MRRLTMRMTVIMGMIASLCWGIDADAAAPRLVFLIGEAEYKTSETLPRFARDELIKTLGFRCTFVHADPKDGNRFPGLEAIDSADLVILSVRRRSLKSADLDRIRKYLDSGGPLVGIRTASHAFHTRGEHPKGHAEWQDFDPDVLGGNYVGHHGNKLVTTVARIPAAAGHPILAGVSVRPFEAGGSLYRVNPLKKACVPLLSGTVKGHPVEPVAWTHSYRGGRIFYTSLGHPVDFQLPAFRRLLRNAVLWSLGRETTLGRRDTKASPEPKTPPVFSGPQVGETLPKFRVKRMFGKSTDEAFDPIATAAGKPVVVIFFHKITRPGIAAMRVVSKFLGQQKKTGVGGAVVFLTEDPTSTANWMRRARRALPAELPVGISPDGIEGPGAYGLNRKVELTILVGNRGKVTANFALVQPSTQVDVPKVLAAIVAQIGGKVPTLASLGVAERRAPARGGLPAEIGVKLRQMIGKMATAADVEKAAVELEAVFAKRPAVAKQVGQIGRRVIKSGRLDMYGTPPARVYLKKWADKYAPTR